MRKVILYCFAFFVCQLALAQRPLNDECTDAFPLDTVAGWCSGPGAYTTEGSTASQNYTVPGCFPRATTTSRPNEVWFTFIAIAKDANISVSGATRIQPEGTLRSPQFAVFTGNCGALQELVCISDARGRNTIQAFVSNLVVGQRYFINVSSRNNTNGTFQLCINNFDITQTPSSDCATGNILCDKKPLTIPFVQGEGRDPNELRGFCGRLGCNPAEAQSNWLKWTCERAGALSFTITPLNPDDDIDFVVFELPGGINTCGSKRSAKCMSAGENVGEPIANWVRCTGATGLRDREQGDVEYCGCEAGSNNFISPLQMVAGRSYALVVNNYSQSGSGYTITFGGTGTFLGPKSDFTNDISPVCIGKDMTFTDGSTFAGPIAKWEWDFGPTAVRPSATGKGPQKAQFNRPGTINVSLRVTTESGCTVTKIKEVAARCCPDHYTLGAQIKDEICPNNNSGSVDISVRNNFGPYTFEWSNGIKTEDLSAVSTGTYSVKITDVATCDTTIRLTVRGPQPFRYQIDDMRATCNGGRDGGLAVRVSGGSGPYQYSWQNGAFGRDSSLRNVASGSYSFRIRDRLGCQKDTILQVRELELLLNPNVDAVTPPRCFGFNDGSINLQLNNGRGPYQFDWGDGRGFQNDNSLRQIRAGTYKVTVRDFNNCRGNFDVAVKDFPPIGVLATGMNPTCFGDRNGSVNAVPRGGAGDYVFNWSNGGRTADLKDLPPGTYRLSLQDKNGCSKDTSLTLIEPPLLSIGQIQPVNVLCFGEPKGKITLLGAGGTPPYSYSINGGTLQRGNIFDQLRAGNYSVLVEDAGGCKATQDVTLTEPPQLTLDLGLDITINLGASVQLNAVSSRNDIKSYAWTPATNLSCTNCPNPFLTPLNTQQYTLKIKDPQDCEAEDAILITVVKDRSLYFPNAFSPYNDGVNNFFTVYGGTSSKIIRSLRVYDRWGNLLFEKKDLPLGDEAQGWDGKFNGARVGAGTYVYVAEIEFIDNEILIFKGDVNVVN